MTDVSQFFGFIWVGIFGTIFYLTLRKVLEYRKAALTNKAKVQIQQGKMGSNPLANFSSFGEMALQAESLLDEQCKKIASECEKNGKNPMDDTGYNTVLKQYQTALQWRARLESPFGRFFDTVAFPFARDLSGGAVKRLMTIVQEGI